MPKRILEGTVVSDKGDKTVVVRVERGAEARTVAAVIQALKRSR